MWVQPRKQLSYMKKLTIERVSHFCYSFYFSPKTVNMFVLFVKYDIKTWSLQGFQLTFGACLIRLFHETSQLGWVSTLDRFSRDKTWSLVYLLIIWHKLTNTMVQKTAVGSSCGLSGYMMQYLCDFVPCCHNITILDLKFQIKADTRVLTGETVLFLLFFFKNKTISFSAP